MNQRELLKSTIDMVYDYLETQNDREVSLFSLVNYFNKRLDPLENNKKDNVPTPANSYVSETEQLGISIALLSRYAKEYVKLALKNTELKTGDEFSFLMALFTSGSHTKTELIKEMALTKTSGIEVLKRLLKNDCIKEFDDLEDKRSKRVELTPKGKDIVIELLPKMSLTSKIIKGNLTDTELKTLNSLLKKLEVYHRPKFENISKKELDDLLDN